MAAAIARLAPACAELRLRFGAAARAADRPRMERFVTEFSATYEEPSAAHPGRG
jgi:hypothetical protein